MFSDIRLIKHIGPGGGSSPVTEGALVPFGCYSIEALDD
jgi:hypothetical protein